MDLLDSLFSLLLFYSAQQRIGGSVQSLRSFSTPMLTDGIPLGYFTIGQHRLFLAVRRNKQFFNIFGLSYFLTFKHYGF